MDQELTELMDEDRAYWEFLSKKMEEKEVDEERAERVLDYVLEEEERGAGSKDQIPKLDRYGRVMCQKTTGSILHPKYILFLFIVCIYSK